MLTLVILLSTKANAQSQKKMIEPMETEKVKIDIWSDIVCPFCLVGKKKLEQAITKLGAEDQVEIEWHSFQLDPEFPAGTSTPSLANLTERKGYPANQVKQRTANLAEQGKEYGIDFQFEKAFTINTFDAHRLIQWSKTLNKSNELKEALMVAHFTDGTDLSKSQELLNVVTKVGLDAQEGQKILDSDAYKQEVEEDIYLARQIGIRGVPFFLINSKESISGAQQDRVFENAIASAIKKIKPVKYNEDGTICLPNGECK